MTLNRQNSIFFKSFLNSEIFEYDASESTTPLVAYLILIKALHAWQ